jgi:hypothetical protein
LTIARKGPIKAMMPQTIRGDDDYRSRMVANALVGGFVGILVMIGEWMLTILTSIH